jgi:hypothetical protein
MKPAYIGIAVLVVVLLYMYMGMGSKKPSSTPGLASGSCGCNKPDVSGVYMPSMEKKYNLSNKPDQEYTWYSNQ